MKVVVAFNTDYGAGENVDLGDAFWLVESDANRVAAERAWLLEAADRNSAVFRRSAESTLEDEALVVFDDVELHHPAWAEIAFSGLPLTQRLRREFSNASFQTSETNNGFVLRR